MSVLMKSCGHAVLMNAVQVTSVMNNAVLVESVARLQGPDM